MMFYLQIPIPEKGRSLTLEITRTRGTAVAGGSGSLPQADNPAIISRFPRVIAVINPTSAIRGFCQCTTCWHYD